MESYRKFFTERDRRQVVEMVNGSHEEMEFCDHCGKLIFAGEGYYSDDSVNGVSGAFCEDCHNLMYSGREHEWDEKYEEEGDLYYWTTTSDTELLDYMQTPTMFDESQIGLLARLLALESDGISITWAPDGMQELKAFIAFVKQDYSYLREKVRDFLSSPMGHGDDVDDDYDAADLEERPVTIALRFLYIGECLQEVMEVVDLFRELGYSIEDAIYAARVFEGLDDKAMIDGIYSTFGSLTRY